MPLLDDLRAFLHSAAVAHEQAGPTGFVHRCDTIELLEMYLGEFSAVDPREQSEAAVKLRDQAFGMCRQLEDMNAVVVQQLRRDIETGKRLRGDLLSELQRYRAEPGESEPDGNLGYDSLDVLVSGILGIDRMRDDDPPRTEPEMVPYQPTPARVILEVVKQACVDSHDIFVDLGSGLGIVPTLVSLLTGATSIGIEVQPSYCLQAGECARRLNISNVRFFCQDARSADFSVGTVFYMYTPFRGAMLKEVVQRLQEEGRRRSIRLCTYGPTLCEAVQEPGVNSFERILEARGPVAIFRSRPDQGPSPFPVRDP